MTDIDVNEDPNENRMLAEYLIETYTHGMRQILEINVSMSRWVLTSLLAINGAAAVAILDQPMHPSNKLLSCLLFAAGVLASLACAQLSTRAAAKVLQPLGKALGYWVTVKHDGYRVEALEVHQDEMNEINRREGRIPTGLGYLSVAFFAGGLTTAALSMVGAI